MANASRTLDTTATVEVLGQRLQLSCSPEEQETLPSAALLLDERIEAIQSGGRMEQKQALLLAALVLANEVVTLRQRATQAIEPEELSQRVQLMIHTISQTMEDQQLLF